MRAIPTGDLANDVPELPLPDAEVVLKVVRAGVDKALWALENARWCHRVAIADHYPAASVEALALRASIARQAVEALAESGMGATIRGS